jgi:hypothetical protein
VVQSAEVRDKSDHAGELNCAPARRILAKSEMCADIVVVALVGAGDVQRQFDSIVPAPPPEESPKPQSDQ